LQDCNPAQTPLPTGFRPVPATDKEHILAKHLPFPQVVGSVLFTSTVSRPELAEAASVLSCFISKWNESHWKVAKHLLRYICDTTDLCLMFDGVCGKQILLGYADADWGGNMDTRRCRGVPHRVYRPMVEPCLYLSLSFLRCKNGISLYCRSATLK
jgi:hypothetical protein